MLFQFGVRPDTLYRRVAVFAMLALPFSPALAQHEIPLTIAEAEDLALAAEPGQLALRARAASLEEQAVVAVIRDGWQNTWSPWSSSANPLT